MKTSTTRQRTAPRAQVRRKTHAVTIRCQAPAAQSVGVVGSFNHWVSQALEPDGRGSWSIALELNPGRYEYLLVVDGQWRPDAASSESVANPYGGVNSILTVNVLNGS